MTARSQGHRSLGPSVGRSLLWGKQPREAPPPPQPHPETVRRGGGPKLKVKERIRIRMDRGGGFDIGASERGAFALVGLLKVKFVSGGTRFMSRKFRETKPSDPPLEIAQSLRRGLVMGDGWIAAVAANLAMDHKQSKWWR